MRTFMACSALLGTALFALQASGQQEMPTGKEVVQRFVEVTGGKEKYEAAKTVKMSGKLSVPEVGLGGTVDMQFSRPDKLRVHVIVNGIGTTKQGINGKVAWEISPTGVRLMQNDEAKRLLEQMSMETVYAPETLYESIKNVGVEEVAGSPCYKIELKRKGSDEMETAYYSVETGLMVKSVTTAPTALGKIKVETTVSDYKEMGGLLSAMKLSQHMPSLGMTQIIAVDSLVYNEKIDDSVFEVPAEVEKVRVRR